MGLGHTRHQDREGRGGVGHIAVVMAGHDLRSLHAPPGEHDPGPGRLEHGRLHLAVAGLPGGGKATGGRPGFEELEPQIHRLHGHGPGPRLGIAAVDPSRRREENTPRAGGHGGQRRQRQTFRIDRQAVAADAGQGGGLPGRMRVEFGREACQQRRARPHKPGPFPQPDLVVEEFEAGAEHGLVGHDHVDMPGDRADSRVGGGNEWPAGPLVAGPEPSSAFGEILDIARGEAVAQIPHQDAIPVGGEEGHRVGIAHIDMREGGGRADEPHVGSAGLFDEVARCRLPQPHAIEAERRKLLEWFAVVVESPRKKWEPSHFEHTAVKAARRILGRRRTPGCFGCGQRTRWLNGRIVPRTLGCGGPFDDPFHPQVVDRYLIATGG